MQKGRQHDSKSFPLWQHNLTFLNRSLPPAASQRYCDRNPVCSSPAGMGTSSELTRASDKINMLLTDSRFKFESTDYG
jgi:hypothetical protein